ncbi:MAG: FGGY-family carbohydrate kinase [Anaerolineaceae bacterium]|nr:FGGY-family carbohydrate kinase [Anaerolineaceae bacterium]
MSEYLLGVDIGTASSKGVLIETKNGTVCAQATIPHGVSLPQAGWVEQDAEETWWGEFVQIVKDLLQESGVSPADILAVGVSGIGPCVLPVDEAFKPLRPAILYGIDTRATLEIEQYLRELGEQEVFRRAGCELSSSAVAPKILWLHNNEPEVYEKARWFLTSQNFVVARLTGKASIDNYTASTYSPIVDVEKRSWIDETTAGINPTDKLPEKYWTTDVVGGVTPEAASLTGLREGTPVIAGTIDAAAEAVSIGNYSVGDTMGMFGSSNSIIAITRAYKRSRTFWGLNWLFPNQYAVVGGMATVGSLTRWFLDNIFSNNPEALDQNPYAQMSDLLSMSRPGANNLVALPYFEGERTPVNDPIAKGAFFGLTLRHTQADLYRALLEAVGFGIRHNLEKLQEENIEVRLINAVGGGTKNLGWMQLIADISNIDVRIPQGTSGAAYGSAILAGIGVGLYEDASQARIWDENALLLKPDRTDADTYDRLYQVYLRLYEQTKNLLPLLAE